MRIYIINKSDSGQTCIKYLQRLLVNAPNGLIYKQIRNKNIKLNGQKIKGTEKLKENDEITIFFSDETLDKFTSAVKVDVSEYEKALLQFGKPDVIYEDKHIIFINKPINMLSQKSSTNDLSANELIIGYLLSKEELTPYTLAHFTPSVCNRLDRNTGGLLSFGKTLFGVNTLNSLFRERTAKKYYRAIVKGFVTGSSSEITAYLHKDEKSNKVTVTNTESSESDFIKTIYTPIRYNKEADISELEIELVTGKPHQIRAHLASIGHPIIGDIKYGLKETNNKFKKERGLDHQMLYAVRFEFPIINDYPEVSGKIISINTSTIFDPYF